MKKIIVATILSVFTFTVNAQEVKKNKNAKVSFEVDGVCGMCKKRIETAALQTKGVKFALWSVKTHQLNLILDERKVDVATVQQNIANVGHDVLLKDKKITAPKKAYESVNPCCKYRDEKVHEAHKGMDKMKH